MFTNNVNRRNNEGISKDGGNGRDLKTQTTLRGTKSDGSRDKTLNCLSLGFGAKSKQTQTARDKNRFRHGDSFVLIL